MTTERPTLVALLAFAAAVSACSFTGPGDVGCQVQFNGADADRDGKVTQPEFLERASDWAPSTRPAEFAKRDRNRDGSLDAAEYCGY